ncbi:hypothetical protein PHAVU_010G006100 [Phaseolus vulgaris]|uniref:Uncharacterized protein n=1 Tax=Phaseolus vulgaris TaxID=3885 RepID=V7AP04_PHAVU|nr:hypothetical protein PHAVU_010G006100g [Phaseolus vulgaris]ESW05946.1 hypothetical protein PHAVU_010G006100g [Phaseolus vulgaris]
MVMQETVKVEDSMGKINISPSQVAFIVDHCANNLSQTRATLRMEAPSLFAASPFGKSSNTSFNLAKILADYISLRREKMILDQERCAIVQEKCRIQNLMEDMHNAVNTYNAFQRPIPVNVPVSNVPSATFHQNPSGVCTATTTAYVQNPNPCNVQLYKKRKKSEPMNEPTIAKRPRGRPPGKKNQHRGLQVLPLSTNQAQISTNSPILETHPVMITNQFFQPASTTCNKELVSHGQNRVMVVDPEKEITSKDSFRNSLINSDTNQHSSPMPQKSMETLDGIFSDHPPPSTHSEGNA